MSAPTIVLYTKPGCSLCDDARAVLDGMGVRYEEAEDARYAARVPVVEVDGEIVSELRVSERGLRRALKRAGVPGR